MAVTPEKGKVRVDAALTNVAIDYSPVGDFPLASGKAFPIVTVDDETGKYWKFDKQSFRIANGTWKPGAEANRITPYNATQASYACERYKLEGEVTDEEKAKADKAIQPEIRTTKDVKDMVMRYWEKQVADALLDSGSTYSSYTAAASTAWTSDNADPRSDVNDALNSIRKNAGVKAKKCKMIIGYNKAQDVGNLPAFRDQFKYTGDKSITKDMMKEYFGVKDVIIHDEIYNSADEGQSASMSDIWTPSKVTLLYTPDRPDLRTPSAGYLAMEKLYGNNGPRVRKYRDVPESKEQDVVEVTQSMDVLETANEAVYIITGC